MGVNDEQDISLCLGSDRHSGCYGQCECKAAYATLSCTPHAPRWRATYAGSTGVFIPFACQFGGRVES